MKYLLQLVEPVVISFQRSALLNIYLVTFRFALLGPKEAVSYTHLIQAIGITVAWLGRVQ